MQKTNCIQEKSSQIIEQNKFILLRLLYKLSINFTESVAKQVLHQLVWKRVA